MGFCRRGCLRCNRIRGPQILGDESGHLRQGVVIGETQVLAAGDIVVRADRGQQLSLLDRVDPQVGFQVEICIQHFRRVAGFFAHRRQHIRAHFLNAGAGRYGCG